MMRWEIARDFWYSVASVAEMLGLQRLYAACLVRMLDAHVKHINAGNTR